MSTEILEYKDLINTTQFTMLFFTPYLRLKNTKTYIALHGHKELSASLLNIYPSMKDVKYDITDGYCYLAFDKNKVKKCINAFKYFCTEPDVKGIVKQPVDSIIVLAFKIPDTHRDILTKYIGGQYKSMFNHAELRGINHIFKRNTGLDMRIGKSVNTYCQSFHILMFSPEYEVVRAMDLNVPIDKFKGTTKEHLAAPMLTDEQLNVENLIKQLEIIK